MIAAVVPVKRGKITLPFFDYVVPDDLADKIKIGQLVEIPLRSKNESGVVRSLAHTSSIKNLKYINKIIHERPFFNPESLKFLEEISELYHTSLGSIIKSALPPMQKRMLNKLIVQATEPITGKKIFQKPKLFIYNNLDDKKSYLKKIISTAGQTLIIVPEAADVNEIVELLPNQKSIGIVTSYLSNKDLFSAWIKIWQGETKIILGTRRALLMSYANLETIIIDEDWSPSHKSWDSAPRLHARDAAIIAAKYFGAAVHIIGHTPTVENYFFARHNVYDHQREAILPRPLFPNLIDMRHETGMKNFGSLSLILQDAITAAKNGSIFLYCNRRGSASYVMCRDCSAVLRCSKCQQAQTYHESRGEMACHYCRIAQPMPAGCVGCGGVNLMYYGKGTEAVLREIKKLLPDDKREIINIENSEETLKLIKPEKNQIIIGTQLAWSHLNWKNISLMAFIDADTPLFVPEYRSAEHLWDLLHDAAFRMNETGSLYVQTNHPEHPVYASLPNPEAFYVAELEQRKNFGYPPYKYLLKLFLGATTKESGKAESERLFRQLNGLTKEPTDTKITPPLELFPPIQKGRYWQAIILKLSYTDYKRQLRSIMKIVPENWKVDPNPNTLLSL